MLETTWVAVRTSGPRPGVPIDVVVCVAPATRAPVQRSVRLARAAPAMRGAANSRAVASGSDDRSTVPFAPSASSIVAPTVTPRRAVSGASSTVQERPSSFEAASSSRGSAANAPGRRKKARCDIDVTSVRPAIPIDRMGYIDGWREKVRPPSVERRSRPPVCCSHSRPPTTGSASIATLAFPGTARRQLAPPLAVTYRTRPPGTRTSAAIRCGSVASKARSWNPRRRPATAHVRPSSVERHSRPSVSDSTVSTRGRLRDTFRPRGRFTKGAPLASVVNVRPPSVLATSRATVPWPPPAWA